MAATSTVSNHPNPVVVCDHVSVRRRRRQALADISVAFHPGITVVAGENGSGKSTLVRAVAGLQPISSGTVTVTGHDVSRPAGRARAREEVGYLAQNADFPGTFTAMEAVSYAAWLERLADPASSAQAALERTGTAGLADRRLSQLSGGELQRVLLAQAIVDNPPVLLLDEPTSGLDASHRLRLHELLKDHVADGGGRTVILVTHLGDDIVRLADRVVVLHDKSVAFEGTPRELVSLASAPLDAAGADAALGLIAQGARGRMSA